MLLRVLAQWVRRAARTWWADSTRPLSAEEVKESRAW
jgi:hypothetical protein